ncbi:MAG TPA: hypothetical protein VGL82_03930 [Bryobacteraceae bacterium]
MRLREIGSNKSVTADEVCGKVPCGVPPRPISAGAMAQLLISETAEAIRLAAVAVQNGAI